MLYKVKAVAKRDRMSGFYTALTDGSVLNQEPDGAEIVASMQRAKITRLGVIEWFETCYCPTPLEHERSTIYDLYFEKLEARQVDGMDEIKGESFWSYLQQSASGD